VTEDRINNPAKLDTDLLAKELKSGREMTVQFSYKKYDNKLLSEINDLCYKYKDNLCIRFYDHGKSGFDCNTLLKIPNVKNLYIDCLASVKNLKALSELKHLTELCIGILEIDDYEFLSFTNLHSLNILSLNNTSSQKLNLAYLANYTKLNTLYINGHTKNIQALSSLKNLKTLSLGAIKKVTLGFLNEMKGLQTLHLILGGRSNLNEIEASNIIDLKIEWVGGFNDLSGVLKLKKLEKLKLSLLQRLESIDIENKNGSLKELGIFSCKNLKSINGLHKLQALNELRLIDTSISFEEFIKTSLPKKLKSIDFRTCKDKKDREIQTILKGMGYSTFDRFGNKV
jgi:protein phosphatase 1 regulatory subunit 7